MKTRLHSSLLKTVLLLVSLASFIGSLATSQAGTNDAFFVGAAHMGAPHNRQGSAQGSLMVYSVMDRFDDDDVIYYEYSSYAIYTINRKLFRHVENRVSSSDQIPEAVTLPAGSYVIEARSAPDVYVRVTVVIKTGRQTIVDFGSRAREPSSGLVRN
jgi:hypothetical protein